MKTIIIVFTILLSNKIMANDMSKYEVAKTAYKSMINGSTQYVGKCSTHEIYNNKNYQITQTIIPYFQPSYNSSQEDFARKVSVLEKGLLSEAKRQLQINSFADIDDMTVVKIQSHIFNDLDLYQMNVGIGGGNGMYLVFNRVITNTGPIYQLMSKTMDGDVQFCDSKVWIK